MRSIVISLLLLGLASVATSETRNTATKPEPTDIMFDFGHVGIDYQVYHNYALVNNSADTVRVLDIHVPCDCSSVISADSVLAPGDTAVFKLKFSTRDFYGPQNRHFSIITDHPDAEKIEYYYLAIIGQWFEGIKPEPIALFFLPAHREKTVAIGNREYDQLEISEVVANDDFFTVEATQPRAAQGDSLRLSIRPSDDITRGTFHSSATIVVSPGSDYDPVTLTIPIKIVRY